MNIDGWNTRVSVREMARGGRYVAPEVCLHVWNSPDNWFMHMTPDHARVVSRKLKKYADFVDPPQKRNK